MVWALLTHSQSSGKLVNIYIAKKNDKPPIKAGSWLLCPVKEMQQTLGRPQNKAGQENNPPSAGDWTHTTVSADTRTN